MRLNTTSLMAVAIAIAMASGGCVSKYTFPASDAVPAAQAEVKLSRDGNGNVDVGFKAKHLAGPEAIAKGTKVYVLWAEVTDVGTFNLGQMQVSKKLNAKLSSLTPFDEFRLFVTAEKAGKVLTPSADIVLETGTLTAP